MLYSVLLSFVVIVSYCVWVPTHTLVIWIFVFSAFDISPPPEALIVPSSAIVTLVPAFTPPSVVSFATGNV